MSPLECLSDETGSLSDHGSAHGAQSERELSKLDVKSNGHVPEDADNSLEETFSALKLESPEDSDKRGDSHTGTERVTATEPVTQPQEVSNHFIQERLAPESLLQEGCLPLYRVIHRESMGHYRRTKGIRAGDGGTPPFSTYKEFKRSINDHGWNATRRASPWISVTVDLLRAFNFAWQLHCEETDDILLVIINPLKLAPGSFMSCNVLREKFGLGKNGLFNTEVLVWQDIPAAAIVAELTFEALQNSQFYQLFQGIPTTVWKRPLELLRLTLSPGPIDPDFTGDLLKVLINELEMDPSSMVTTQIALTMLAWTEILRQVHWIVGFEDIRPKLRREVDFRLWEMFRDELSGWDRHVLKRDGNNRDVP